MSRLRMKEAARVMTVLLLQIKRAILSVFTESHKSCDNNLDNEFNQFCFDNVTLRNKYIHDYVTSEASSEFLLQDQLKNIRAIQHKKLLKLNIKMM